MFEMALWNVCGDLLESSGWASALTEAQIASSGTADSFLKVTHLTRTRHAHQVAALALYNLEREAFLQTPGLVHDKEAFQQWKTSTREKSSTFHFWDMVLRLEILIFIFIRSHREGNFPLYVETLEALVPWFFALDHTNYARWVPVHIRDMKSLPSAVSKDLQKYWVVAKTKRLVPEIKMKIKIGDFFRTCAKVLAYRISKSICKFVRFTLKSLAT